MRKYFGFILLLMLAACGDAPNEAPAPANLSTKVESLSDLSLAALRTRRYDSAIEVLGPLNPDVTPALDACAGMFGRDTLAVTYQSDGLQVLARLDIPRGSPPDDGFPVVMILHGWVGRDSAPDYDFDYSCDSFNGRLVSQFSEAGFVVLTPGFRGHGRLHGESADGIEFLDAWDNGSYLSPVFYAIDALNLAGGVHSLNLLDWSDVLPGRGGRPRFDLTRISVTGHSQGGDVALIALGISGEDAEAGNLLAAGSTMAGTFPSRFTQLLSYYPMQTTAESFQAGDGRWNATAIGAGGEINANFVFGWPPDWIETPNVADWSWQSQTWFLPNVAAAISIKLDEMYNAIIDGVDDIDDAYYELSTENGAITVIHDERIAEHMAGIGAFDHPQFLSEPLSLHYSDQDFYSTPGWNTDLCLRINDLAGQCREFSYPGTTHSLGVSSHRWFSPPSTVDGLPVAIDRDIELFRQPR